MQPRLSVLIPAKNSAHCLEETVSQLSRFLETDLRLPYEIVLIPNGSGDAQHDLSVEAANRLREKYPAVVVVNHRSPAGKGAALKAGFLRSSGEWICFMDADLPYDLGFLRLAAQHLGAGADFVTGNRRLLDSSFSFPVSLLPLVYKRHRLGLWFNRCVRLLYNLQTSDTQAGVKAMNRKFAELAFAKQTCPGFLADLEYFMVCTQGSFRHVELPVRLFLSSEKSTVRLFREFFATLYWLPRLLFQKAKGCYLPVSSES